MSNKLGLCSTLLHCLFFKSALATCPLGALGKRTQCLKHHSDALWSVCGAALPTILWSVCGFAWLLVKLPQQMRSPLCGVGFEGSRKQTDLISEQLLPQPEILTYRVILLANGEESQQIPVYTSERKNMSLWEGKPMVIKRMSSSVTQQWVSIINMKRRKVIWGAQSEWCRGEEPPCLRGATGGSPVFAVREDTPSWRESRRRKRKARPGGTGLELLTYSKFCLGKTWRSFRKK